MRKWTMRDGQKNNDRMILTNVHKMKKMMRDNINQQHTRELKSSDFCYKKVVKIWIYFIVS